MKNALLPVSGLSLLSKLLVAGSAFGLALAASPASATVVYVDYMGTVTEGFDGDGLFGPINGDLTGLTFTAHYLFDISLGDRDTNSYIDKVTGGYDFGNASPALGATLTIAGQSVQFTGERLGINFVSQDGQYAELDDDAGYYLNNQINNGPAFEPSLTTPFSASTAAFSSNYANSITNGGGFAIGGAGGSLFNTNVSGGLGTGAVAAVPEPATWAMMLIGFGGIGFAMCRRKNNVTTTIASAA
jgi:hypothetical protein